MIFKKSQPFIELAFSWLINLKFLIPEKQNFSFKIFILSVKFATPWILPPGTAAPLTPSSTPCF